ncbi:glutathione S-transferase 4 [Aplysia californica]|uniref:Glutathione S-transferase 4 n=1 Tax=Aplysia californica TaxID=6500 RepID=A0ABM1VTQ6_APLCA|nr:glutathione S-transferase 4 [Aplysia californica]
MAATPRSGPRYKLYYFDLPGRAEAIRLAFKTAGVPFADIRVTTEQWKLMKPKTPYGSLPVLEIEGRQFGETGAILRWAGRKFGLSGKGDADELVVEAVLCQASALTEEYAVAAFQTKDEAEKEKLLGKFKENALAYLDRWEALAKDTKSSNRTYTYLVGTSLTVADLYVYRLVEELGKLTDLDLSKYKKLRNLKATIEAIPAIKDYLASCST